MTALDPIQQEQAKRLLQVASDGMDNVSHEAQRLGSMGIINVDEYNSIVERLRCANKNLMELLLG